MAPELSNPILIWFVVGFVFLLLELAGSGFIFFFFGIGAWVVAVTLLVSPVSLNAQLILFLVTSVFSLILLRNICKRLFMGFGKGKSDPEKDLDEYTGKKVLVKEDIAPGRAGKVEIFGTLWNAESDEAISAGTTVSVIRKDNLTLHVKK